MTREFRLMSMLDCWFVLIWRSGTKLASGVSRDLWSVSNSFWYKVHRLWDLRKWNKLLQGETRRFGYFYRFMIHTFQFLVLSLSLISQRRPSTTGGTRSFQRPLLCVIRSTPVASLIARRLASLQATNSNTPC